MRSLLDVTVAIPAHPARIHTGMLTRALGSVWAQTMPPSAVSIAVDVDGAGAPPTRQRALDAVTTPWVAFLDSDDFFDSNHLQLLSQCAIDSGADYVYSYWHGPDLLGHYGRPFDPTTPVETTTTILIRTDLARKVGFAALPERSENTGEDWGMVLGCIALGAKIMHLPRRTWTYTFHQGNTSGLPNRGDAVS